MFTVSEKKHLFVFYKAPALGYAILIFVMSSIPGHELPHISFLSFDKIVHTFEFGLFGMLLFRSFRFPKPFSRPYLLTLCIGIPFAAIDEIHQLFVAGRNCDIVDFMFDVAGLVIFTAISSRLNLLRGKSLEG